MCVERRILFQHNNNHLNDKFDFKFWFWSSRGSFPRLDLRSVLHLLPSSKKSQDIGKESVLASEELAASGGRPDVNCIDWWERCSAGSRARVAHGLWRVWQLKCGSLATWSLCHLQFWSIIYLGCRHIHHPNFSRANIHIEITPQRRRTTSSSFLHGCNIVTPFQSFL